MAITEIPSIISTFLMMGIFTIIFAFIFWVIRKINKTTTNRKLRRKLAAAKMAGE